MKKLHSFNEVFDGQKVFRKVLEAMSNPGRCVSIKEQAEKLNGENQAFLALAMTLLDNEVTLYTCDNKNLAENISLLTLSKEASIEEADFIFVENKQDLEKIFQCAKCGTLEDPQKSATLIIKAEGEEEHKWNIYGAGIDGTMELFVPALAEEAITLRKQQSYEYPQGVDMIFVKENDEILAIPRLVLKKEEQ